MRSTNLIKLIRQEVNEKGRKVKIVSDYDEVIKLINLSLFIVFANLKFPLKTISRVFEIKRSLLELMEAAKDK